MKRTRTKSGVYFIKNIINGKVYTGSSFDIFNRLKYHKKALEGNRHSNIKLQNAWNKYGASNFQSIFFEKVIDLESIVPREQYWIDYMDSYKNGYNMCPTAGSSLGSKRSDKTKRKMSNDRKGRGKGIPLPKEHIEKLSIAHMGQIPWNKGKLMSDKARLNMSIAHKGVATCPCSEKTKKKIGDGNRGKHHTPEAKEKMYKALTGRDSWNKGTSLSKKHKKNLSIANKGCVSNRKGIKLSDATKRKISDSVTHYFINKQI